MIEDANAMAVDIVVEGIEDPRIVREIEEAIRDAFGTRSDKWIVAVAPSEHLRGRWDIGIRGPSGRHFLSVSASRDQLAHLIGPKVRDFVGSQR
jgi:hypothetical protein